MLLNCLQFARLNIDWSSGATAIVGRFACVSWQREFTEKTSVSVGKSVSLCRTTETSIII